MCLMDKATSTTGGGGINTSTSSSAMMVINNNGQLSIPQPTNTPMPLMTKLLYYGLIPLIAPLFVTYKFITDKSYRVTTCNFLSKTKNLNYVHIFYNNQCAKIQILANNDRKLISTKLIYSLFKFLIY